MPWLRVQAQRGRQDVHHRPERRCARELLLPGPPADRVVQVHRRWQGVRVRLPQQLRVQAGQGRVHL